MALLHDAGEYVIGDMISPVKGYLGENFQNLECKIQESIHLRFGLLSQTPQKIKTLIKEADLQSAFLESVYLAGFTETEALKHIGTPPKNAHKYNVAPLTTREAYKQFLQRFETLQSRINKTKKPK